ncbi:hypothetical protein Efla_005199 [Eimeria flavescens]
MVAVKPKAELDVAGTVKPWDVHEGAQTHIHGNSHSTSSSSNSSRSNISRSNSSSSNSGKSSNIGGSSSSKRSSNSSISSSSSSIPWQMTATTPRAIRNLASENGHAGFADDLSEEPRAGVQERSEGSNENAPGVTPNPHNAGLASSIDGAAAGRLDGGADSHGSGSRTDKRTEKQQTNPLFSSAGRRGDTPATNNGAQN